VNYSSNGVYVSQDYGVTWAANAIEANKCAISGNGQYIITVSLNMYPYINSNYGNGSFTQFYTGGFAALFYNAAINYSGSRMYFAEAAWPVGGALWVSTDYSSNWTNLIESGAPGYTYLATNSNGDVVYSDGYISLDSGSNFSATAVPDALFIQCSADGSRSISAGLAGVYVGSNYGSNYTQVATTTNANFQAAMSADGQYMYAALGN
jgi:hypothetical protein